MTKSKFIWQRGRKGMTVTLYWHCFYEDAQEGDSPLCQHKRRKFKKIDCENHHNPASKCKKCEEKRF